MEKENVKMPAEFADICPIADKDFHNEMTMLVQEPMFRQITRLVLPEYRYSDLSHLLLSLNSKNEFQEKVMRPFVGSVLAKTSDGLTLSGAENLDPDTAYLFITNHRDIVLDPAQLSYSLLDCGRQTCEIAIGNNLLIYDWITRLVRLNKSFIVKRNLGRLQTLAAAVQLSSYIHFAITSKNASVWIAQRE
ncbi:MAG: acyltransferase, partial [Muribaculaceae bacterium]|nr:acyltransferase [Muribaculaceae bacterium]